MEVIKTDIDGVLILEPRIFNDQRGYFFESYNHRAFCEAIGRDINFVQDNESMSTRGVMRGLHFQRPPFTQAKLVRCVVGRVLDVAVDIRKGNFRNGLQRQIVDGELPRITASSSSRAVSPTVSRCSAPRPCSSTNVTTIMPLRPTAAYQLPTRRSASTGSLILQAAS